MSDSQKSGSAVMDAPSSQKTAQKPASQVIPDSAYNNGFIILITLVATIGGFLFGFDSGVINGTVDGLKLAFKSDSVVTGFNVASMLLGCAAGAFLAGSLAGGFFLGIFLALAAAGIEQMSQQEETRQQLQNVKEAFGIRPLKP